MRNLREIMKIVVTGPTPDLLATIQTIENEESIIILAVSILPNITLSCTIYQFLATGITGSERLA
jgi:hypothetical protein